MNMNDYRQVYALYLRYSTNQTLTSSYHSSDLWNSYTVNPLLSMTANSY